MYVFLPYHRRDPGYLSIRHCGYVSGQSRSACDPLSPTRRALIELPRASLIAPEHVPLRTQDSSVTRPGDMGTSSTKVNGLLRAITPPTGNVGVRTCARPTAGDATSRYRETLRVTL
ncbi:uncharacterized protein LOC116850905 [Odontomachus brunneus]|uniref:uncharacterized protein LOC116850905 n=1 Tax=Odontomachus brunneus TaxID=486640 RepID=UPI0013F20B99|nr:uncharacterized protein LOC116850905 [Odontomachus brunneus]